MSHLASNDTDMYQEWEVEIIKIIDGKNSENQIHHFYQKNTAFCWLEKYNYN